MELSLKKPIVFFDLETTGVAVAKDRIVEISVFKVYPNGNKESKTWLVNPTIPIPAETTAVHGIDDAKVANEPTFKELAHDIKNMMEGCDLAGYNSNRFDIPLLAEEFLRADLDFDMKKRKAVDVQNIFHKMEQRTLSAAYKFYCGKTLENAHDAMHDTIATWEVLEKQIEQYELNTNVQALADLSRAGNHKILDMAGRIALNDNNEVVYNFGKHKGKTIENIAKTEPGYYGWMLEADFPLYTKSILRKSMEAIKERNREEEHASLDLKLNALQNKFKK